MKKLIILLLNLFSIGLFGQWINLGQQGEVFMVNNNTGFKLYSYSIAPNPSVGTNYDIKKTTNDWATSNTLYTKSGSLGCCFGTLLNIGTSGEGYILENSNTGPKLYQSYNGASWNLTSISMSRIFSSNGRIIYPNPQTIFWSEEIPSGGVNFYLNNSQLSDSFDTLGFSVKKLISDASGNIYTWLETNSSEFYLFKSNNLGVNWDTLVSKDTYYFPNIYFYNYQTGYYFNSNSELYKSIDGGYTWNLINISMPSTINDLKFVSDSVGLLIGDSGLIKITTDGGISWRVDNINTLSKLNKIQIVDSSIIYVSSSDGLLFKNDWITSISKKEFRLSDVKIHPNPTSNYLYIEHRNDYRVSRYQIFNLVGNIVKEGFLQNQKINVSDFHRGIYILSLEIDGEVFRQKFIKE